MSAAAPPCPDSHADQRGRITATMVSIYTITIASVALRFLSRKLSKAGFWWDDFLCLTGLFISLICPSIILIDLHNGFGQHICIFPPQDQKEKTVVFLKNLWIFVLVLNTSNTLAKLAILAFYYRIFPVLRFRQLVLSTAGLCLLVLIGVNLSAIFQCQPIHYAWDQVRSGVRGRCFNVVGFWLGMGAINAVLNLVIFVLPIPLLQRLAITIRQRIILMAIFTLAGFVVIVSTIWVAVLPKVATVDVTWRNIDASLWSAVEPNMAVVCACIPSLHPLFRVIGRGFSAAPSGQSDLSSTGMNPSLKRIWGPRVRQTSGNFSQLEEVEDLRPLGHGVMVCGGRVPTDASDENAIELPQDGIRVQTDVTLTTSNRLDYDDRLF